MMELFGDGGSRDADAPEHPHAEAEMGGFFSEDGRKLRKCPQSCSLFKRSNVKGQVDSD